MESMGFSNKLEKLIAKLKETEEGMHGCDFGTEVDFIRESADAIIGYWKAATRDVSLKEKERTYAKAASGVLFLNRLSERLGMEPFAEVAPDQEKEVKKWIDRMYMADYWQSVEK